MEKLRKTILVVDDDQALLKLFSTILELQGFKVIKAQNGYEGLVKLSANSVDLVIADWKMPIMNGLSLLKKIRNELKRKDLPVLMISASEYPSAMEAAKKLGACNWLRKPFKFNALLNAVKEILPNS